MTEFMETREKKTSPIRVMIADDHAIVRTGASRLIKGEPDMEVVGEVDDGSRVLSMARDLLPDVLVLDISMPGISGIELVPILRKEVPGMEITLFSMHRREVLLQQALEQGVKGYVLKASAVEDLLSAIRAVYRGQYFLSAEIENDMIGIYLGRSRNKNTAALSDRERQVLLMVASGLTTRQIAEKLFLSPRTVEKHRAAFMQKLHLKNMCDVVQYAIQEGLLPISE